MSRSPISGDLDGDGIGDIAVGALGDDDGGLNRGAVWVLFLDEDLTGPRRKGRTPCGRAPNPAGTISVPASANPGPGSVLVVEFDNPLGTQSHGSIPVMFVSARPDPSNTLLGTFTGTPWLGPDRPARVEVAIPGDPSLAGQRIYLRGLLFDPSRRSPVKLALTEAIEIEIE